jgi:hypothetical protein
MRQNSIGARPTKRPGREAAENLPQTKHTNNKASNSFDTPNNPSIGGARFMARMGPSRDPPPVPDEGTLRWEPPADGREDRQGDAKSASAIPPRGTEAVWALRVRKGDGVMSIQDESDAVTKAWTYAVLDALEAADEGTRLEIARILCPAGFEIVSTEHADQLKN